MAAVGRDVVVIDADLRRPTQHQRLGEPFGEGLADLGSMDVEQVLRRTRYEHLWYLPAGVPDRHPADVVTVTLPRAHRALAAEGRTLLIDAPPLHGVAETPFVLSVAHHVILVVDASSVKLIEFEQAVERLRNSGLVLMGVVINRVRSQSHGATYDSYLLKADVAAENRRTTRPRAVEPPVPEPVEEPVRSNETELPPQSRLRFREG
jgi:Mrp family chromosome partitioning ATPase